MTVTTQPSAGGERQALKHLWWIGLLALIASIGANVVVQMVAVGLFEISPEFRPLWPLQFIGFTTAGVIGAVVIFAIVTRLSEQPVRLFQRIAIGVLLVSFLPDLALLFTKAVPGTSAPAVGALLLMHVLTAAFAVGLLTGLARGA